MIMWNLRALFIKGVFLFLAVCAGCGNLDKQPLTKQKYSLNVSQGVSDSGSSIAGVLKVRRFRIASDFEGTGLIYKIGKVHYESDFYNVFLSPPASIITEIVQKRLEEGGVFENVTDDTSVVESMYVLEGKVLALYGDYVNTDEPKAVVEILFSVIKNKSGKDTMAFQKAYRISEEIDSCKPAHLVIGFNRCLEKILTELEKDLRETLR
jgi:cholesterol transport system auxiliary component